MNEAGLRVVAREDGQHELQTLTGEVLAVCATNAEAWRWIDRRSVEGQDDAERHRRIRQSGRFNG